MSGSKRCPCSWHNPLTDIGKLAVLEDHKVVLLGQGSELINQILIEILNNINMRLFRGSLFVCSKHKKTMYVRNWHKNV
jgi:hypothetical protein